MAYEFLTQFAFSVDIDFFFFTKQDVESVT